LGALLNRVSRAVEQADLAAGLRSRCDLADGPADAALLESSNEEGLLPMYIAEDFLSTHGDFKLYMEGRCPFGLAAAALSTAIYIQAGASTIPGYDTDKDKEVGRLLDTYMYPLLRVWEDRTPQFFFDLFASHWRIWKLLEILETEIALQRQAAAQPPPREPVRPAVPPPRVLFLSGGTVTFKWGSFTVRGRQFARGLRTLGPVVGADARVWNTGCARWCNRPRGSGEWSPAAIVHIKFPCACALRLWRHSVHIYDPVDVYTWRNRLVAGSPLRRMDAILVTTSLALCDLRGHPVLRAGANQSAHWLPFHHSNFMGRRKYTRPRQPVRVVGLQSAHRDGHLQKLFEDVTSGLEAGRTGVKFLRLDPKSRFLLSGGRVLSPQQTTSIYEQMCYLDVSFARASAGCSKDWWLCSRWRTGQRLVNLLAAGIPTVVWGDAGGHLDVVMASWPERASGELAQCRPHRRGSDASGVDALYPSELVVASDHEAKVALRALLQNASLRVQATHVGLRLADRFALPKIARHLARLLRRLIRRRAERAPSWRVPRSAAWRSIRRWTER